MKTKSRNLDVIHHGLVLISDGKGRGRPSRLLLSKDQLSIQIPLDGTLENANDSPPPPDSGTRHVVVKKKGAGLGLSIKGGTENAQNVPIIISKIFPGMPADLTGQLMVGDAIVEVDGVAVEGRSHDEVVSLLKTENDELRLAVRHCTNIASYLKPSKSLQPGPTGDAFEKLYEPNTWKSAMKAQSELGLNDREKSIAVDGKDSWKTISQIPLPMAYLTRYLWGTDNIRQNALEVRAVDGTSSGIIHCEDSRALEQWIAHIQSHIQSLNHKSIRMSNKYLHQSEQITYIGWVNEYLKDGVSDDPKQKWEPRFLILKGGDVCLFESPPLNSEDLNKCLYLYKTYDVAVKMVKNDSSRLDKRENCFYLETSCIDGTKHYISIESTHMLEQFEAAYHKTVYTTVSAMQTRTFACSFEGRPSGLVLDIKQGISLYDIPTKSYAWQYRFRDLHSSCDDGKVHLQMVFKDDRSLEASKLETKDIECDEVVTIAYNLHSFMLTKIVAADPDFLKQNPLL